MKRVFVFACIFYSLNNFIQAQWFWQNPLPTGNSLNDVSFSDPQHGFIVGDAGTILYTSDGGGIMDYSFSWNE